MNSQYHAFVEIDVLKVLPIKSAETYSWLLHKHYAKRIPNIMYAFGLFEEKELVGVITYGMPASPTLCKGVCGEDYKDCVLELNRLCLESNQKNYASYLVANSLKLLPKPTIIVSYADTSMNHVGYIYQASNFIYTGMTLLRTDVDTGDNHSRHYEGLDMSKRKVRPQKHRYIYFHGSKKQKKLLIDCLNYDIQSYPKGDNLYYDSGQRVSKQQILF